MGGRVAPVAVAALLAAGVSGALAAPREDVPPDAIAVVAGEPIPRATFDAFVERMKRGYAQRKREFPPIDSPEYGELKDQIVVLLVERVMVRQKAAEMGIVVTEVQVEARIAELKQRLYGGDEKRFQEELRKAGLTEADLRDDLRAQMVVEAVYRVVTARIAVTDDEIAGYYRAHRRDFTRPEQRLVQHVLVRSKTRIERIYAQLRAGASFDALARRYSLDPGSRAQGGRLLVGRGQTVQPFDRIAFALRTGAVSRPFRTRFGWHVVKALSPVKPARLMPLSQVSARIRAQLFRQKRTEAMGEWVDELRAEYAGKVAYAPGFEPTPRP